MTTNNTNNNNILSPLFDSLVDCYKAIRNIGNRISTFVPYELNDKQYYFTDKLIIPIGVTNGNKKVHLTIGEQNSTILCCGTVGSGKSIFVKNLLTTVINNYPLIDLWLLDTKIVELGMFKDCKQVSVFEYDTEQIDMRLEQLLNITLDRYNTLFENGYTNANDYNRENKDKMLPILIVIEELVLLSKKSMKNLLKICSLSRGCNIWCIYSVQRPSNDILSPTLKAITNVKIVFKCENTKTSQIAMESDLATTLKGKGNGFYIVGSKIIEFQGFFISDKQIEEIISKHRKPTPMINKPKPNDEVITDNNNKSEWWCNL